MIQRQLTPAERQVQRSIAEEMIERIHTIHGLITVWPVTCESEYNHAIGALQHLRQAIADVNYYMRLIYPDRREDTDV